MVSKVLPTIFVRGGLSGARLLLVLLAGRYCSAQELGAFIFALTVAEIGRILSDLGIDTLAIRRFTSNGNGESTASTLATILLTKACSGTLIFSLLIYLLLNLGPEEFIPMMCVTGATMLTSLFTGVPVSYFQARSKLKDILAPIIATIGGGAVAAGVAISLTGSTMIGSVAMLSFELLCTLLLYAAMRKEIGKINFWDVKTSCVKMLNESIPIALTGFAAILYSKLDVIILGLMEPASSIGTYGLLLRLIDPLQFIAASISWSIYTDLAAHTAVQGDSLPKSWIRKHLLLVLCFSCVASFLYALVLSFLPPLIPLLLADANANAIAILLTCAVFVKCLNPNLTAFCYGLGLFRPIAKIAGINLTVAIVALPLCIQLWGPIGAAIAILLVESANTVMQLFLIRKGIFQASERKTTNV